MISQLLMPRLRPGRHVPQITPVRLVVGVPRDHAGVHVSELVRDLLLADVKPESVASVLVAQTIRHKVFRKSDPVSPPAEAAVESVPVLPRSASFGQENVFDSWMPLAVQTPQESQDHRFQADDSRCSVGTCPCRLVVHDFYESSFEMDLGPAKLSHLARPGARPVQKEQRPTHGPRSVPHHQDVFAVGSRSTRPGVEPKITRLPVRGTSNQTFLFSPQESTEDRPEDSFAGVVRPPLRMRHHPIGQVMLFAVRKGLVAEFVDETFQLTPGIDQGMVRNVTRTCPRFEEGNVGVDNPINSHGRSLHGLLEHGGFVPGERKRRALISRCARVIAGVPGERLSIVR